MSNNCINATTAVWNWFYFTRARGRIPTTKGCSSVYINLPPSYIFQSPLFLPRHALRTTEGVDGGSLLKLILTFSPLDFFFYIFVSQVAFLLAGRQVDELSVLTRVGFNEQNSGFRSVSASFPCWAPHEWRQEWRSLLCVPAADAAAVSAASQLLSRHIYGIRQPKPNGTHSKDDFRRFSLFFLTFTRIMAFGFCEHAAF